MIRRIIIFLIIELVQFFTIISVPFLYCKFKVNYQHQICVHDQLVRALDQCMDSFSFFAGLRKDVHDERSLKKTSHLLSMTKLSTPCFLLTRLLLWNALVWNKLTVFF